MFCCPICTSTGIDYRMFYGWVCDDCGRIEELAMLPDCEDMLEQVAEAPIGEPPAEPTEPLRRPMQPERTAA